MPVFKNKPLVVADKKGHPIINLPVAFTMLASMTMTVKDVYRFSA